MAGRLEDEEYWQSSERKGFNFDDDEVSYSGAVTFQTLFGEGRIKTGASMAGT